MSTAYSTANLKKSSVYFLVGKLASGILTFVILIVLARLLDNQAYGAYATLLALLELGLALGDLGISWASNRYIPEYRLHASARQLGALIASIITFRLLALTGVAAIVFLFKGLLARYLHLDNFLPAIQLYIIILAVEGLGRAIRDEIFSALLQQKIAQSLLILRNLILLFLVFNGADGSLDLNDFAWMELYASIIATTFSLLGIIFYLLQLKQERQVDWQPPTFKQFVRTARAMYASFLLTMARGQQVFMLIVNALLGLEAAAVFGFASNLNNLLRRYLPAELLMGLIQPKLVADYSLHKDMNRLSRHALFAWKLSLIVLVPALSFFIVCGESFSELMSGGNIKGAGSIMAGLALSLVLFSQRRILETIANILEHPEACVMASMTSLVSLPLVLLLIDQGLGLWAVVIALFVAELIFNLTLVYRLKQVGCPYGLSFVMACRLAVLIGSVTFILWLFLNTANQPWLQSIIARQQWFQLSVVNQGWIQQSMGIVIAVLFTFLFGWGVSFFSKEERKGVLRFFKSRKN